MRPMSDKIVNLAEGFEKADPDAWQRLAEGGLKTRDLTDVLDQKSRSGFAFPVLATAEELPEGAGPVAMRNAPRWDIRTAYAAGQDPKAVNCSILLDLAGGATSLSIACAPRDLANTLEGVHLDMVGVHLAVPSDFADSAAALKKLWVDGGVDLTSVSGSFGAEPELGSDKMASAVALAREAVTETPRVAIFRVSPEGATDEVAELAAILSRTISYVAAMEAGGIAPQDGLSQIRISLNATVEQFLTIAKFRALRLLFARVAELLALPSDVRPHVDALIGAGPDAEGGAGCVEATVAALAAAVAGADTLVIPALTGPTAEDTFRTGDNERIKGHRLARNIQHLLAEESHLGFVEDPAAGSFAIERMTHDLARRAWQQWQSGEGEAISPSDTWEAAQ